MAAADIQNGNYPAADHSSVCRAVAVRHLTVFHFSLAADFVVACYRGSPIHYSVSSQGLNCWTVLCHWMELNTGYHCCGCHLAIFLFVNQAFLFHWKEQGLYWSWYRWNFFRYREYSSMVCRCCASLSSFRRRDWNFFRAMRLFHYLYPENFLKDSHPSNPAPGGMDSVRSRCLRSLL